MVRVLMAVDGSDHDAETAHALAHLLRDGRDVEVIVLNVAHVTLPVPPEEFEIPVSDTQAYRQFGNSVVVPVVTEIARAMTKHLA